MMNMPYKMLDSFSAPAPKLNTANDKRFVSVDIFSGAGGSALGSALAGFQVRLVSDFDRWACNTLRTNQVAGTPLVSDWQVFEGDVRGFDWTSVGPVDMLSGTPSCVPVKVGEMVDPKDKIFVFASVLAKVHPKAFIVDAPKRLSRHVFANYCDYVEKCLTYPSVARKNGETWENHLTRLCETGPRLDIGPRYRVTKHTLKAADYGVPQQRTRTMFVGIREDLDTHFVFPQRTHSRDALWWKQWVTGDYWSEQNLPVPERNKVFGPTELELRTLTANGPEQLGLPWRTVRDAISDLPDTETRSMSNHIEHPLPPPSLRSARQASVYDFPAKMLKVSVHGVPGGENTIVDESGRLRYFTVREKARLFTFPDGYQFVGGWNEETRQMVLTLPVLVAQTVAEKVAATLQESNL